MRGAHGRVGPAVALAYGRVAAGPDALHRVVAEDPQRFVPIARADAASRRQPARLVVRRPGVRIRQRVPAARDRVEEALLAALPGYGQAHRHEREHDEQHHRDAPPRVRAGLAPQRDEAHREPRQREHDDQCDEEHPELHAGLLAQVERDAVVRQRGLRERPHGGRCGPGRADEDERGRA